MAIISKVTILADRCKGCGLCVEACPKKIVTTDGDTLNAKGFHPAMVTDQDACIACGFCAMMCPDVAIRVEKAEKEEEGSRV